MCSRQLTVKSLLEAGADISAVDLVGDTVLHQYLKWNEDLGYLQLLLDHGADVNARGMHGNTALHSLFSRGNNKNGPNSRDEAIKFLLKNGADGNVKNNSGHTVLELAVGDKDCSLQTFKLLLDSYFDENTLRSYLFRVRLRYDYDEQV
jgi:ankyrin repeat protein